MILCAKDYYNANDPEYLKKYPAIKLALYNIQAKCPPRTCECCYFFRWLDNEADEAQCALVGIITHDYEKRAKECPLGGKKGEKEDVQAVTEPPVKGEKAQDSDGGKEHPVGEQDGKRGGRS